MIKILLMMRYLWAELTRRDKAYMLCAWIMGLLLSVCMMFIGQEIRFWADHADALRTHIGDVCLHVVPWLVVFGGLSWTRVYLSSCTAVRLENYLHMRLMRHVLNLFPLPDNILNRFILDIPAVADGVTHQMAMGVRHAFFCAMSFIMMWLTSPILTFCIVLAVPFIVIPFVWQLASLKQLQKTVHHERDRLTRYAEECLNNIVTIQAFSQENETHKKWELILSGLNEHGTQYGARRASVAWWIITSASLGVFGIVIMGAQYVAITTGDMMSFIFYAVLCVGGLAALNNTYREIASLSVAAERLYDVLHQSVPPSVGERHFPTTSHGTLACHHVHFSYPNHMEHEVLRGVTFTVTPGELAALVGPSGVGKSTIFSLILRFYNPQKGTIYIDGVDVQKVSLKALRQRIGYVGQDPVLFDGTVYDNIMYGKPTASRKEVYAAMEESGVSGFLDKWPNQEYTKVQDILLSGGQRQCVALARALIRKPALFLLDEPTNALDAENEALIQGAFKNVARQHTTLMIAHRLSTVVQANRIIVLDGGEVQAVGTHNELVTQSDLYRRFVTQQFPLWQTKSLAL